MRTIKVLVIEGEETRELGRALTDIAGALANVDVTIEREDDPAVDGKFDLVVFPTVFEGVERISEAAEKKVAVTSHRHGLKKLEEFKFPFYVEREFIYCSKCAEVGGGIDVKSDALNHPYLVAREIIFAIAIA